MRLEEYTKKKNKEIYKMETKGNKVVAKTLTKVAQHMLTNAANSRCVLLLHQPKQPEAVKKFRRF